ncbi:cell surface protein [Pendulispora albinea]|uniref:Cell surface protein n=1 Tax=Pendulispora albinea TaxID=2741071 RepID=A0ABZ2M4F0_9BACT
MRLLSIVRSMLVLSAATLGMACSSSEDAANAPPTGADASGDGDAVRAAGERFITSVVSFTPGACAGFGQTKMPGIVQGPPKGAGNLQGSLDVVSLGYHGEIVVSFGSNAIVDGPGADFIVFENVFDISGDPQRPYAEPAEVSVSDDGTNWTTFPCTATSYPYGACAGWHPIYSAPGNGISPTDPNTAGGDAFDLAAIGVTHARYVRIVDKMAATCSGSSAGFDLDAVSIVNAEVP